MQGARLLLYPLLCLGGLALLLSLIPVQALSVGEKGLLRRVFAGDRFILRYTHSMYGVEVREHFLVGQEEFTLFRVESSEAALEYFGLESSGPDNVRRTLKAFTVAGGSSGKHEILLNGCRIQLHASGEEGKPIPVTLARMSLIEYLARILGR